MDLDRHGESVLLLRGRRAWLDPLGCRLGHILLAERYLARVGRLASGVGPLLMQSRSYGEDFDFKRRPDAPAARRPALLPTHSAQEYSQPQHVGYYDDRCLVTDQSDIVVRPAVTLDLDALVALNAVVQSLHVQLEPKVFKAEVETSELQAFFAGLLDKAGNGILIAEMSAEPVGYLWYELQERPPTLLTHARRRIYIQHVAVRESARGSGMATALLHAVEAEALARDVDHLALDTWTRNEEALRFFHARGFQPFNVVLAKALR